MDYLDTSVLAAYYAPEPLSPKVQRLLSRLAEPALSWLVEVELASALAQKVRAKQLLASDAARISAQFQQHRSASVFQVLPVLAEDYAMARRWLETRATSLRAMDALHLAVASTHKAALITADRDLALAAKHFKVKHVLVA